MSNTVQLHRVFKHQYNITDPEVRVQMIEDPRSIYWNNISPEAAHIKDKAKNDKNDPNNYLLT
jgi:hypothetical protein